MDSVSVEKRNGLTKPDLEDLNEVFLFLCILFCGLVFFWLVGCFFEATATVDNCLQSSKCCHVLCEEQPRADIRR